MSTPTSKYIIKIDDDFKFVTFDGPTNNLERIITKYYKNNDIKITSLSYKTDVNFIKLMIKPNSFFNNNDFDADEFVEKINEYTKLVEYFNIKSNKKIEVPSMSPISSNNTRVLSMSPISSNNTRVLSMRPIPSQDLRGSISIPDGILSNNDIIEGYIEYKYDEPMSLSDFNDNLLNSSIKYNIYYNNQFNNIFIIGTDDDMQLPLHTNQLLPEFSLLFSNFKLDISQEERLKLSKEILVNEDDARIKINRMMNDTIIDSKLTINEMKELITKYFTITTNLENRVRFTNIWEIITSKLKISEPYVAYLKRQLPVVLEDLKLQKKRYADGIYWYGLVRKYIKNDIENEIIALLKHDTPIDGNTYENYLKERVAEIKDVIPPINQDISQPDEFLSKLLKK